MKYEKISIAFDIWQFCVSFMKSEKLCIACHIFCIKAYTKSWLPYLWLACNIDYQLSKGYIMILTNYFDLFSPLRPLPTPLSLLSLKFHWALTSYLLCLNLVIKLLLK